MSETTRLIRNTGIIAVGGMATKLVQFLLLPLYTSVLSTAEYGTVDYLNTIALFCVPAVSLLMDEALFRFLIDCRTDDDRRRAVTASCAVLLCGCLVFCACAAVAAVLARLGGVGWVVALVAAGAALQMVSAVLRGFGDTASYAIMNFCASFAMILMNVLFIAVFHWGVTGMLAATVLAQGGAAAAFAIRARIWRYMDVNAFDAGTATALVRYSIPLIPNKVSWTIMNMSSRLVIMGTLGASAAGVFAVAYKFPNVMDQVYGFFYMSWKESSARALNSDEDEVAFYNGVYRALRRFMMSVVLVMTALMPLVYGILIDGSYREGLLYVPVLLLATYFSNISGFYGGIFTAHKDTGIMGTTTVVSAAVCLVLNLVLIPSIGLYGASLATLAATFTVNEYRRVKVARHARLEEDRREQLITLACLAAVTACFYIYAYSDTVLALAVGIVVAFGFAFGMNRALILRVLEGALEKVERR